MRSEGTTASTLALDRADALLMVIDVQEKLAAAMPKAPLAELERNAAVLIRAARRLEIPVIATEQYPKGLGPTVASLRELLPQEPMSKMEFSCGASKPIARHVLGSGRKQVVVVGMEAHVCVFQTVRDLLRGGFSVFVAQDAVLSRSEANREVGLRLCEKAGATLTSTETVLFDLLGVAGTPEFKELTALIK
ncbi:MAG TPA: isochorismatase family protein [Myxococcales bacterium]